MDLRTRPYEDVVKYVECSLDTKLDLSALKIKRRTIGGQTDRGTWVRIEARAFEKITGQGWNGIECAEVLVGVAKPRWLRGFAWRDIEQQMAWRADETQFIKLPVVKSGGL